MKTKQYAIYFIVYVAGLKMGPSVYLQLLSTYVRFFLRKIFLYFPGIIPTLSKGFRAHEGHKMLKFLKTYVILYAKSVTKILK